MMKEHVVLSDRPEEQYKAIEWAKKEYDRLMIEKGEQIAVEVRKQMAPILAKKREAKLLKKETV